MQVHGGDLYGYIGRRTRQLRPQQSLIQSVLGNLLHIARQTVFSWQRGNGRPDLEVIGRITTALQVGAGAPLA